MVNTNPRTPPHPAPGRGGAGYENATKKEALNKLRFFEPKVQKAGEEIWDMGFRPSSSYQMSKLIELHLYTGDRNVTYNAAIAGIDMQELRTIVQSGKFSLENIKATADLGDVDAALKTPFPQRVAANFKDTIKESVQRLG